MTIQEAYNIFESFKTETSKRSEIKVYNKFLDILTSLENKEFSKEEMQSIETELDRLKLNARPENRKRYFKKALGEFQKYLKKNFSLTPERYFTGMGIGLGASFGVVLGILIGERFERSLGISLGVSFGLLIGLLVGRYLDSQAKAEGKML